MIDKGKSEKDYPVVTDKIMLYEDTMERHKYKDPNMKSLMDSYTYNVPGSISHLRSFPRQETVKFNKPHSRSATKDQMMKGRLKGSQMEAPNKFHMQYTYDAPSSGEQHEGTTTISLDQFPHMTKKVLRMFQRKPKESEQNRNHGNKEGQIETKDTTTENDDTLRDSTQPDYTRDLTTDPDEDPTTPMDEAPVEVATNNHDKEDIKSDKPASQECDEDGSTPPIQHHGSGTDGRDLY